MTQAQRVWRGALCMQFFAMTVPVPVFWITMWACVKIFFYTTAFLGIIGQQVSGV